MQPHSRGDDLGIRPDTVNLHLVLPAYFDWTAFDSAIWRPGRIIRSERPVRFVPILVDYSQKPINRRAAAYLHQVSCLIGSLPQLHGILTEFVSECLQIPEEILGERVAIISGTPGTQNVHSVFWLSHLEQALNSGICESRLYVSRLTRITCIRIRQTGRGLRRRKVFRLPSSRRVG